MPAFRPYHLLTPLLACLALCAVAARAPAQERPRAIVADFENTSTDRHSTVTQVAQDTVATQLDKRGIYEVVTRREIDAAARKGGYRAPYRVDDLAAIAKDVGATLLVTGEVKHVVRHPDSKLREVEVGLIVRVRDLGLDELVNGAAERGVVSVPLSVGKTDGELALDAAMAAAVRCVGRIEDYKPVSGTILSNVGLGPLMLNRGLGDGVKPRQEFLIYRDGHRVGRAHASRVSSSYTELVMEDNAGGIRAQDRAVSIFPEPKFR